MLRKIIFKAVVLMLLIVVVGTICNRVVVAIPGTITVPSLGYETIQEAINAANPGDIIMVTLGIYYENLAVNKTVSIIGENPATTIIDGGGVGNVITITSPNVVINGFTIQNGKQGDWPYCGISIFKCDFVVINNTVLRDNYYGLQLLQSNNSQIFNNLVINNLYAGMKISESNNNVFFENTIKDNIVGLWSIGSASNTFYHNNFVNNTNQLQIYTSPTTWDNGAEGNFWSDYIGSDEDKDGIGDSQYGNAGDKYPLMGTFTNFTISYESQQYFVSTICNSTISNFQFNATLEKISFIADGPNGTIGFCRIAIPNQLVQELWRDNFTISVNGGQPTYNRTWTDAVYNYAYFAYNHTDTAKEVTITPEFSSVVILSLMMIATLTAAILTRKRVRMSSVSYHECCGNFWTVGYSASCR